MRCDQWRRRHETPIARRYDMFVLVWQWHANGGRCDAWGGAQSGRAVLAWRDAGFPPIAAWMAAWLGADDYA